MAEKYDPDKMNADDIDPSDPEAVTEWLEHPNTEALHEDLGRAFRALPAEEQQAMLEREIAQQEQHLAELDEALATRDYEPEVRTTMEELRATMDRNLTAAKLRMHELDAEQVPTASEQHLADVLRYYGMGMQLAGVLTAALGISAVRREWTERLGIVGNVQRGARAVLSRALLRLRRMRDWVAAKIFRRPVRLYPVGRSLQIRYGVASATLGIPDPPSSGTPEERLAWLEQYVKTAFDHAETVRGQLEETARALRAADDEHVEQVRRSIGRLAGGGLVLQTWGVCALLAGIVLATIPDKLAGIQLWREGPDAADTSLYRQAMGYRRGYVRPPRGMIGADVRRNLGTSRTPAPRQTPVAKTPTSRDDVGAGLVGFGLIVVLSVVFGVGGVGPLRITMGSIGVVLLLSGCVVRVGARRRQ